MSLTADQTKFYENTLAVCKQEIEYLDQTMKDERVKFNSRVEELTNARMASVLQYGAACTRLGIENELEAEAGNP